MKYKGTLKEKFINLFGKLDFEKNIECVLLTEYIHTGKCSEIYIDFLGDCLYEEMSTQDNHCDGENHYNIKRKLKKYPVSKRINELAITKDTRFKNISIANLYDDEDYRFYKINLFHFNKHMKYKRKAIYIQELYIIRKIDEICEILKYLDISHFEYLLKTLSFEEILEISKIKKLEKQMLEETKHLTTAKAKLQKF